ncbi:aminotransferase class V-fold PLP-dependent enzyme [Salibacter sp.]|uniref:aminotransferase class V-fold PLP-dependent enzyme n=1 Tax=Salibacter sp. TaxID=2010995 RepID=UPI00287040CF|nr:aminotransferase class V-fold PLP-dependent enzyme [Salibacter sp.]MDR9397654.1 aminotransferase class V-fold PLP-dependent enzyme [Salibacter sp.]MDR9486808.1 aminotransferase class V-fold PLP-dependent enzyme [Salibacter sp.]
MTSRRKFIQNLTASSGLLLSASAIAGRAETLNSAIEGIKQSPFPEKEDVFWKQIQLAYTVSPNLINLNNGGVSPQPAVVQEAVKKYTSFSNETPSYYMWRVLDKDREAVRTGLADLAGTSPETIAINRNTTEALDTVIFGLDLEKGDEVVLSHFDYPNMMSAWKQREMRDGIKLKWVDLKLPESNKEKIVEQYLDQIGSKTKVLHITHLINWLGQVVPVKELCEEANKRGIITIVDGAHTFAHLNFSIADFNCDYFGTSLHKWLCAPFGTGMLYMNEDRITKTWPLTPDHDPKRKDIRKFENLGTRSIPSEIAIGSAIDFHNMIGSDRKAKRLHFLKNYWASRAQEIKGITINTPSSPDLSGALAHVSIEGKTGRDIERHLLSNHRIHCVAIEYREFDGVRITPNVYTVQSDLDKLLDGLSDLTKA